VLVDAKAVAVAAALVVVAGTPALGSSAPFAQPQRGDTPVGTFIYERDNGRTTWLESRDLFGSSRVALTRRTTRSEIRRDCCARWSAHGSNVAFVRKTPKLYGLYVVTRRGTKLRQLVSATQLQRWVTQPITLSAISWARDGSKLLFSVHLRNSNCANSDGIYRVNVDGSDLRPLWRRPSALRGSAVALGWSPDGRRALFDLVRNDGDCYGTHVGPETLVTVPDKPGKTVSLLTESTFGGARWSPDGAQIAYTSCAFAEPCNIGVIDPTTKRKRLLTHYETFTSPLGGFDELPFLWSPNGEIILGRFLSVLALDPKGGATRELVKANCLRPNRQCPDSVITLYGVAPRGNIVFEADDQRYVVTDIRLIELPDPGLAVDDLYLP
jgi:Tol biopolymer transport system component